MSQGHRLYHDVAYPYGPIPIQLYRFVAAAAGNTPIVYLWTLACLSAISAALIAHIAGRHLGARQQVLVTLLWIVPTVPLPGATIGGYTSSIYMPIERIVLLAAAWLWRPPNQRRATRGLAIGAVLGICQGVRFGTGVMMLVALVISDLMGTRWTRERGGGLQFPRLRASAWVVTGFAVVEVGWVVWALATLPRDYALEFLWPMQMWETHRVAIGVPRWPTWSGWRMAVTQCLLPVALAGLGLLAARGWPWRQHREAIQGQRRDGAALLLLIFYALGTLAFFRHEHHFRQFVWLILPAAACGFALLRTPARYVVVLVSVLALWPALSALLHPPPPDRVWLTMERGFSVTAGPEEAGRVEFLEQARGHGPVLFAPNGTGWLYAYGVPHVSRHAWFYSPAVVRPFEEGTFAEAVGAATLVIACDIPDSGWPIPECSMRRLRNRFRQTAAGAGCRISTAVAPDLR